MRINMPFFYKKLSLTIERDSLYLGQIYNNDSNITERKILCVKSMDYVEDILFESPNYIIEGKQGHIVEQLVSLSALLKHLGYPERLKAKDIRKIYNQVLSSPKTLHNYCNLFGVVRLLEGYMGKYSYWPCDLESSLIDPEEFYRLEYLISLPTNPSKSEKQNDRYSFQKRLFFMP